MSLIAELARAKSEEDVKDAYIKALGLKKYTKGLIDIRTEEIWFESKDATLTPAFKSDCLIWMLFNGSNLSAGADGLEWNGRTCSLVNHFIPFSEDEVGASGRFESDFMVGYLRRLKLSKEAKAVMDAGRALWTRYHSTRFEKKIRDEFKLNRPDAGWYQIRRALEADSDNDSVDFEPFKTAYDALSRKLRPQVFEHGFLIG